MSRPSEPVTTVWLIRHAEVEPRYQSIFGGRIDMEISARGHKQAVALARYLRSKRFAALYASPMKRVQQTLAPLQASLALPPIILDELREVDFGDWTGRSWEEVRTLYGISAFRWLEQLECNGIPNAEGAASLRARLEPCLNRILTAHAGEHIAVLCHGGVIRMLIAILLKWPFSSLAPFEIEYSSITQLLCAPSRVKLELVNFTPWRDLPTDATPQPIETTLNG
jgi:broad specificity phosphatase PhoE